MHELLHAVLHALEESLYMTPFLIIAFFLLEYFEAKLEQKSSSAIEKAGKAGPITGALLGIIPQCGFSVIGANFYAKRVITVGTLLAIFLSTSDEALLVMLTSPEHFADILLIIGIKLIIAVIAGYLIDLILGFRSKKAESECHHCHHHEGCEDEELIGEEHCCSHTDFKAIFRCTFKRTLSVWFFIFVSSAILGYLIELIGEDSLRAFMLRGSLFQPVLTAIIGLIPNCAPSVILAQMYLEGTISLGSVISGLCTGAGVGLLVLFRVNRGAKHNALITAALLTIGALSGVIIDLIF